MGEIADMMINGDLDYFTGEYLGEGHGYPRTNEFKGKGFIPNDSSKTFSFLKKYFKYSENKCINVVKDYGAKNGLNPVKNPISKISKYIQSDWNKFKEYINQRDKFYGKVRY